MRKGDCSAKEIPMLLQKVGPESDGFGWPRRDGLKWPHLALVVVLG
jgi:hypothetical protein